MLVFSSFINPQITINQKVIKNALAYGGYSFEEICRRKKYNYQLFKRIYNNDLNVTLKDLIEFSKTFEIYLKDFISLC